MKTDDLIARLANDLPGALAAPRISSGRMVFLAVLTAAATVALSALVYGMRPDGPSNGLVGLVIWSALALLGLTSAARARLPEPAYRPIVLTPVCGLLALLLILALWAHVDGQVPVRLDHVLHCLRTVGLLSLAPFVGLSVLMRSGAPASPTAAGAVAGLVAGAIGALAYSVSCPINDPLASLSAHAATVLVISGVGALIGWRLYAW
jgi:hypothetical protein